MPRGVPQLPFLSISGSLFVLLFLLVPTGLLLCVLKAESTHRPSRNNEHKRGRGAYFLIKLLFPPLDVLHLHGFFTQDRTQVHVIVFIT